MEAFEADHPASGHAHLTIIDFKNWMVRNHNPVDDEVPDWEGKEKGRGLDSVISTFILHMNRYAKSYSKSAILGSEFSSQEDFIYLINLKAFGEMSKTELIRKNVHDKPAGIQIINRLIAQGWVEQTDSSTDRRKKVLKITEEGLQTLASQMGKIRKASTIVSGDLSTKEKLQLIKLLTRLNDFHHQIYTQNVDTSKLLDTAYQKINSN